MPDPTPLTGTELAYSYQWAIDVLTGTNPGTEEDWTKVRFASNINPTAPPKMQNVATYDDFGSDNQQKVGESPVITFYVQAHRITQSGKYLPEVEKLLEATQPTANGKAATVTVRTYDCPETGKGNPNDAYMLTGTVQMERANTGTADVAGWNVTVTGTGPRVKITNPKNA